MTTLRRRLLEDLQLRRLAPKTPQCYVAAVQQLARHYGRAPDQLSDAALRQYFLVLLHEKKVAESTFRIHLSGSRFFYERTLKHPWPVFDLVRPRGIQTLPAVLSPQEVRSLLALVEHPNARMCLWVISACGLRLRAGTQLQVTDLDPQRMLVRVRQGKGGKDRYVPLAERTLQLLLRLFRFRSHRWPPKIQQIFERDPHRYVVVRPTKNTNLIDDVRAIPDDDIPQFVAPAPQFLNKRYVNGYSFILPPHIGNIDHTMRFRS
jgi:site-specific recombinase XerD